MWKSVRTLLLVCAASAVSTSVHACNVPVFRYALERWRPDAFELVVFHREPLSEADRKIVQQLDSAAQNPKSPCNLEVILVDLNDEAKLPKWQKKLWEEQNGQAEKSNVETPWLVILAPGYGGPKQIWAGRLAADIVQPLVDSPARQELIKRLFAGDSVVWIYLTSTPQNADDEKLIELRETLDELQKKIELPEGVGEVGSELYAQRIPLKVQYSVLVLDRAAPAEQMFVRALLHNYKDLWESTQPAVMPVFGRGRVLDVLTGKAEMEPSTYESAAVFLSGACSCQVKQQNPGFDLLTKFNWDSMYEGEVPEELAAENSRPHKSGTSDGPKKPTLVPIPGSRSAASNAAATTTAPRASASDLNWAANAPQNNRQALYGGVALGGLLFGVAVCLSLRGLWYRI